MESIEKQIEKRINIIIDRYLKLKTPIKNIKKYLTGKNIKTIIDELAELEDIYIKRYQNKTGKDFKEHVRKGIIKGLKDREYDIKDTSESLNHIKLFEEYFWNKKKDKNKEIKPKNLDKLDPFDEEDWNEDENNPIDIDSSEDISSLKNIIHRNRRYLNKNFKIEKDDYSYDIYHYTWGIKTSFFTTEKICIDLYQQPDDYVEITILINNKKSQEYKNLRTTYLKFASLENASNFLTKCGVNTDKVEIEK